MANSWTHSVTRSSGSDGNTGSAGLMPPGEQKNKQTQILVHPRPITDMEILVEIITLHTIVALNVLCDWLTFLCNT